MKRAILSAVVAFSLTLSSSLAWGQQGATSAPALPHKVGLIDMAHVFKNYKKFEVLRNDLKAELEQSEAKAKEMATQVQQLQAKMKAFDEGSPEYTAAEQEWTKAAAEFESFRRSAQRELVKKEVQIYHQIYMEVADAVRKYADYYKYTLVIRFSREEMDADNPQALMQSMSARQVVYHRAEDDITDSVLEYLNRKYPGGQTTGTTPATGGATSAAPRTGARPTGTPRN